MFDSRFIRLLTALLVATWSPGQWCCCGAHANGSDLEVQVSEASCCARPADTAEPATDTTGCCGTCEGEPSPGENSCGCLHGPTDAAVSAAVVVITQGRTSGLDALVELPAVLAVPAVTGHGNSMCRGSPHAPPAGSLLSLHCQLTT